MTPEQARRLGTFLRKAREKQGLSLSELEDASGVGKATLGRIEQGLFRSPAPDKLRAIAKALNLQVADVLLMADYADPSDLPSVPVYMRARYSGELSAKDLRDIESFINERRASSSHGPRKGEDEG